MPTTYTSATPLNFKEAVTQTVELSQIQMQLEHERINTALDEATLQASEDREAIRHLISVANDQIKITDMELLELFDEDVQKKYKHNHTDKYNFTTEPEALITILQADQTYTSTFSGYTVSEFDDSTITITKTDAPTFTFTITQDGLKASCEVDNKHIEIGYITETVMEIQGD